MARPRQHDEGRPQRGNREGPGLLNKPDTILPQLYSGGRSAVGDASKFFYQFPTAPGDRPYLGVRHPTTGLLYWYLGLPMGSANSPAVTGRMGSAFIRLMQELAPEIFLGECKSNTWRDSFSDSTYNPKLGHGHVLISEEDGLPVVLLFAHIDDFFLEGPTWEKTAEMMQILMDAAMRVGLLFNPTKISLRAPCVKYCGFMYNTTATPKLRIPTDKRERAVAILDYVMARREQEFSRLALLVVYGTLQLLVPASPGNLGQTFLRRSCNILYADVDPTTVHVPTQIFYSKVALDDATWADLEWWRRALRVEMCRPARYEKASMLAPGWGDGSGTGTGGTVMIASGPYSQWMRVWSHHVFSFSSNWLELRTLCQMMEANRVLTTAHVFDPAPYSPSLVPWILHQTGLPATTPVTYRPWDGCWIARPLLHRTTLWCPLRRLPAK